MNRPDVLTILAEMPLYQLLDLPNHPDYRHLQPYQGEALGARTEVTLATGDKDCLKRSQRSNLWHPFQNEVALFPGGWHKKLHLSYSGYYRQLCPEMLQWFTATFPKIRHLNIIFTIVRCTSDEIDQTPDLKYLLELIHYYGAQLVTLRLWASGPLYYSMSHQTSWCSILFEIVRQMPNLATLWLDLVDEPVGPLPGNTFPPIVPLEFLYIQDNLQQSGENQIKFFAKLKEFRYATSSTTDAQAISSQMASIQSLQCIHIGPTIRGPPSFNHWNSFELSRRLKFREICVLMQEDAIAELDRFFSRFPALTRLQVVLPPEGPNFLELFRSLYHAPNLQVLIVETVQSPLFTQEDVDLIAQDNARDGLVPLPALRILVMRMGISMESCADISFEPLFSNDAAQPPILLPNLASFKMCVQMGACQLSGHKQTTCVMNAVNRWFTGLRHAIFVEYRNQKNGKIKGGLHVVGGFLGDGGINPYPLPVLPKVPAH